MNIPERGLPPEEIRNRLAEYKAGDLPWRSGRIMAYVYNPGEAAYETGRDAYMEYLTESALDPTTYPSVMRLEREVVRMLINLLRGDETVVGNMTSGGTESILLAMKSARDWARATRPEITAPEMVLPRSAHPSFHKACTYFGIKPVVVPFNPETFQVDPAVMREAVTPNTIVLVGSAPGYAQGVVDPIPEIAALAREHGLWFHVDACVGGIHLSFMREIGHDVPPFDWTVPGVTSMSTDMHKFGYAPKNASLVMYRSKEYRKYQIFACTQTATYVLVNPTVLSTKSGGPMASSWAILNCLGREGYKDIVREVQAATETLVTGINAIDGLRVLGKPDMCLFSFTSGEVNLFHVQNEMHSRGWYIQPQLSTDCSPYNLHITVNQSSVPHVDQLLADLRASVEAVRAMENPVELETLRGQVQALVEQAGDRAAEQILALGGVSGTDLPDDMALLNSVMECLPHHVRDEMLVGYFNELFQ